MAQPNKFKDLLKKQGKVSKSNPKCKSKLKGGFNKSNAKNKTLQRRKKFGGSVKTKKSKGEDDKKPNEESLEKNTKTQSKKLKGKLSTDTFFPRSSLFFSEWMDYKCSKMCGTKSHFLSILLVSPCVVPNTYQGKGILSKMLDPGTRVCP